MAKIRVLIADDHAVLRAGLRLLINSQPDLEVVGEAADAPEALRKTRELTPDVLTLDLAMPGGGSIKMIDRLRQECPATRVLVLTMHDDHGCVTAVLAAGASGYVIKSAADTELMAGIRAVFKGRTLVDMDQSEAHGKGVLARPMINGRGERAAPLSHREQEVLELVARGYTNQEAANLLFLSVKTVETYRTRIAEKLGVRSRADIVRYAVEIGLLGPDKFQQERPIS